MQTTRSARPPARIFRARPLEPQASAANVLAPALAELQGPPARKPALRRG